MRKIFEDETVIILFWHWSHGHGYTRQSCCTRKAEEQKDSAITSLHENEIDDPHHRATTLG